MARSSIPLPDRFWSRVEQTPTCWFWIGSLTTPDHYGSIRGVGGRSQRAHRVSWELTYGAIPHDMQVCHTCDVPRCVNPGHLFLCTQAENVHDMMAKGRHRPPPRRERTATGIASDPVRLSMRRAHQAVYRQTRPVRIPS